MAKGMLGKFHSEETKQKIRLATVGKKKHSKEAREKMSLSRKGNPSWSKGKKFSEEYRKKISDGHKGQIAHNKGKANPSLKGDKNPSWKGGITPINKQIRHSFKYRQWRSDVYQRDDYTCQMCFVRGVEIHADHIKQFALIFQENKITSLPEALDCEEFWNINNGRTLCKPCHMNTSTYLKKVKWIK